MKVERQKLFQFMGLFVLCLIACGRNEAAEKIPIGVGRVQAFVEIAATDEARQIGLMHRQSLGLNEGMLFIFPEPKILSFWMKNTPLSLDIGFFNREGVFAQIRNYGTKTMGKTIHRSPAPALYALEMTQGWFHSNKIAVGFQAYGYPSLDDSRYPKCALLSPGIATWSKSIMI